MEAFDGADRFLQEAVLTDKDLTRSIIGVVSDLDFYQLPDAKGFTSLVRHLSGITSEFRQKLRDEVLGATKADFQHFAAAARTLAEHGRVTVLTSHTRADELSKERPGWLVTTKVL